MKLISKLLTIVVFVQASCTAMQIEIINKDNIDQNEDKVTVAREVFHTLHNFVPQEHRVPLFEKIASGLKDGSYSLAMLTLNGQHFANIFYGYDESRDLVRLRLIGYDPQSDRAVTIEAVLLILNHIKSLGKGSCCCMHKVITQSYKWLVEAVGYKINNQLFQQGDEYPSESHDWYERSWE